VEPDAKPRNGRFRRRPPGAVLADLGLEAAGVQPVLEDIVGVGAGPVDVTMCVETTSVQPALLLLAC
jgi:hypothetical protein